MIKKRINQLIDKIRNKRELWLSLLIFICVILLLAPFDYGSVGEMIIISLTVPCLIGAILILLPNQPHKGCDGNCTHDKVKKN